MRYTHAHTHTHTHQTDDCFFSVLGLLGPEVPFSKVVEKCHEPVCAARPSPGADKVGQQSDMSSVRWSYGLVHYSVHHCRLVDSQTQSVCHTGHSILYSPLQVDYV